MTENKAIDKTVACSLKIEREKKEYRKYICGKRDEKDKEICI